MFRRRAAVHRVCQREFSSVCVLLLGDDFWTKPSTDANKLATLFAIDPALHFYQDKIVGASRDLGCLVIVVDDITAGRCPRQR